MYLFMFFQDSYFLSAEECITAATLQNKYKNVTNYCMDRFYGSKFVTVVASGDESLHVNFHGYQVSNQCAAMVEADILCPTLYTPELAYVRETPLSETHYITDVQYCEKNQYGAEVLKNGRPLPVEYLLVDVPAGMPKEPHYTFHVGNKIKFNLENRQDIGQIQGGQNLSQYCGEYSMNQFLEQATDFHFLLYLMTNSLVTIKDEWMKRLCEAVKAQDRGAAMDWAKDCEDWHQLVALAHANSDGNYPKKLKANLIQKTFQIFHISQRTTTRSVVEPGAADIVHSKTRTDDRTAQCADFQLNNLFVTQTPHFCKH